MYLLNEKYQQRHLLAVALLLLYAKIDCAVVQSASWCACADYLCRCLSLRCAPQRGPVCFPPLSSLTNSTIAGCLSFCHYVEYHTQPRDCFDCADFYSWYLLWLMQRGSCTCFFFFFFAAVTRTHLDIFWLGPLTPGQMRFLLSLFMVAGTFQLWTDRPIGTDIGT